MDTYTGLIKDSCERDIQFNKKWIRYQMLWVVFNLSTTCFNAQTLMNDHRIFSAIAFGAMLVVFLLSLFLLMQSWDELKNEKLKLKFLTELHETQLASGERQQYINAKLYYEQLKEALEKNNDRE